MSPVCPLPLACLPLLCLLAVCFGFRFVNFFSLSAKQTACCSVVLLGVVAVVLLLLSARCDGHFRSTHTHAYTQAYAAHTCTYTLTGRSTVSFVNEFPFRFALALRFHSNSTCCTRDVPLSATALSLSPSLSHLLTLSLCALVHGPLSRLSLSWCLSGPFLLVV